VYYVEQVCFSGILRPLPVILGLYRDLREALRVVLELLPVFVIPSNQRFDMLCATTCACHTGMHSPLCLAVSAEFFGAGSLRRDLDD
jgi:hypothetical protein